MLRPGAGESLERLSGQGSCCLERLLPHTRPPDIPPRFGHSPGHLALAFSAIVWYTYNIP